MRLSDLAWLLVPSAIAACGGGSNSAAPTGAGAAGGAGAGGSASAGSAGTSTGGTGGGLASVAPKLYVVAGENESSYLAEFDGATWNKTTFPGERSGAKPALSVAPDGSLLLVINPAPAVPRYASRSPSGDWSMFADVPKVLGRIQLLYRGGRHLASSGSTDSESPLALNAFDATSQSWSNLAVFPAISTYSNYFSGALFPAREDPAAARLLAGPGLFTVTFGGHETPELMPVYLQGGGGDQIEVVTLAVGNSPEDVHDVAFISTDGGSHVTLIEDAKKAMSKFPCTTPFAVHAAKGTDRFDVLCSGAGAPMRHITGKYLGAGKAETTFVDSPIPTFPNGPSMVLTEGVGSTDPELISVRDGQIVHRRGLAAGPEAVVGAGQGLLFVALVGP